VKAADLISREEAAKRLEALAEQREGSFSGEAFEFAAKIVRGVPSAVRWIPVTERLPEDNERVLVYHDDGMIRFGINKGGFADVVSSLYLQHNHRTCFSKVTHWMPLPEPPKGE
jgi:hypothetical protein